MHSNCILYVVPPPLNQDLPQSCFHQGQPLCQETTTLLHAHCIGLHVVCRQLANTLASYCAACCSAPGHLEIMQGMGDVAASVGRGDEADHTVEMNMHAVWERICVHL
jgi:hypothetical protein